MNDSSEEVDIVITAAPKQQKASYKHQQHAGETLAVNRTKIDAKALSEIRNYRMKEFAGARFDGTYIGETARQDGPVMKMIEKIPNLGILNTTLVIATVIFLRQYKVMDKQNLDDFMERLDKIGGKWKKYKGFTSDGENILEETSLNNAKRKCGARNCDGIVFDGTKYVLQTNIELRKKPNHITYVKSETVSRTDLIRYIKFLKKYFPTKK